MQSSTSNDEIAVRALYQRLIESWNRRDASAYAECFSAEGIAIGFDGSQMVGANSIKDSLSGIFAHHPTAAYITIVRQVSRPSPDSYLILAAAGMIPPGQKTIKAEVNAIQSMVACRSSQEWKITLFQNTPAAFHGRPEAVQELTQELQVAFEQSGHSP